MSFAILSLPEANFYKDKFTHCVSIADQASGPQQHVWGFKGPILKIKFNDYENPNFPGAPTHEEIERIGDFLDNYIYNATSKDKLMIHCMAGISRSAATGVFYLLLKGHEPDEALDMVVNVRPQCLPNRLMISLIDEFMDMDGRLIRKNNQRVDKMLITGYGNWIPE